VRRPAGMQPNCGSARHKGSCARSVWTQCSHSGTCGGPQECSRIVDQITIRASQREASAWCPACGRRSHRVVSRCDRRLPDLPWQGRAVAIAVTVRRFRRGNVLCERRIFVERFPKVMAAYSRRCRRLAEIQRHIGTALGGAAGGRLARRLALPVSRDALLRLVRRRTRSSYAAPPDLLAVIIR
jgi:transposase